MTLVVAVTVALIVFAVGAVLLVRGGTRERGPRQEAREQAEWDGTVTGGRRP